MALNIVDQSYSGTYAPYLIRQAVYGMDTVKKGIVYVKSGIKKLHTIDRIDLKNPLTPRQANPTDSGLNGFTIDGRTLIPKDVQAIKIINPRDFETSQLAEQLSNTILAREVPADIQTQMVQLLLNRCAEQFENGLWMGSEAFQGSYTEADARYQIQYFNGFLQQMVNDPLINLSSVTPAVITNLNVLTIMNDLIAQATTKKKALITDEFTFRDMKFMISATTCTLYGEALTTGTSFKGNPFDTGYITPWRGYKVERIAGMPDNTIIFCRATEDPQISNLWVGMNSQQDWDLKIARVAPLSEEFGILGKWKWCVNYGWGEEIFMFTTLAKADFLP